EAPWHAAYPAPKSKAVGISQFDLLVMLEEGKEPGKDFVLVDLRRNDHAGGTIAGSINLPAQSLYPSIPSLYRLFKAAGIPKVIWYCGSSKGRGNRAASWFADYVAEQEETNTIQSVALVKGIKGWVEGGPSFASRISEFEAGAWQK
ncbi:uncharacterized protein M437DRAFT_60783, partial [Aureobasidium melanogenum CBS 110374]